MKKLIAAITVLFLAGSAAAYTDAQLENFRENYNNQTSKVPSVVADIVGGETVNVNIDDRNDTIGAEMKGLEIESLKDGGYANETINVYANSSTVKTVLNSSNSFQQVEKELDQNDIKYNSTTTGGSVKLTIFDSLRGLASTFGIGF